MVIFSSLVTARAERITRRLAKRFCKDETGATAVEFAFVAIPFFTLLFGILELAIVFFVNSALVHSTSEAGRLIRTGNFQACGAEDEFKALVCSNMKGLANCAQNVRIDVISGNSFKTITLPDLPLPAEPTVDADGNLVTQPVLNGTYNDSGSGDPLVVRSTFYYRLMLPPLLTRLENPKGSGLRILTATTAFKNEPFPDSGTCNANTQAQIDGT